MAVRGIIGSRSRRLVSRRLTGDGAAWWLTRPGPGDWRRRSEGWPPAAKARPGQGAVPGWDRTSLPAAGRRCVAQRRGGTAVTSNSPAGGSHVPETRPAGRDVRAADPLRGGADCSPTGGPRTEPYLPALNTK